MCSLSVLMDLLGGEYVGETSRTAYTELVGKLIMEPTIPSEVRQNFISLL